MVADRSRIVGITGNNPGTLRRSSSRRILSGAQPVWVPNTVPNPVGSVGFQPMSKRPEDSRHEEHNGYYDRRANEWTVVQLKEAGRTDALWNREAEDEPEGCSGCVRRT